MNQPTRCPMCHSADGHTAMYLDLVECNACLFQYLPDRPNNLPRAIALRNQTVDYLHDRIRVLKSTRTQASRKGEHLRASALSLAIRELQTASAVLGVPVSSR